MASTEATIHSDWDLPADKVTAIRHLIWMGHALGAEDGMIRYMAAMMIEQIRTGPPANAGEGAQLALGTSGFSDIAASI